MEGQTGQQKTCVTSSSSGRVTRNKGEDELYIDKDGDKLILPMAAENDLSAFERAADGQAGQQNTNDETVGCTDHLLESCVALLAKYVSNLSLFLMIRDLLSTILTGVDRFCHSPDVVVHQHQADLVYLHDITWMRASKELNRNAEPGVRINEILTLISLPIAASMWKNILAS